MRATVQRRKVLTGAAIMACLVISLVLGGCKRGLDDKKAEAFLEGWELAFNSHDLPTFTRLYAEKGWFRVAPMVFAVSSRSTLRERMEAIWRRMPDLRITAMSRVLGSGNRLAFTWTMRFTSSKAKRRDSFVGATFMKLAAGRISEEVATFSRPIALPPRSKSKASRK